MAWPTGEQPFGPNHAPLLAGIASDGSKDASGKFLSIPVAVNKTTGAILVLATVTVANTNTNLYTGQQTVSNSAAVQISAGNNALTNGMTVKAPSTNLKPIYVGLSGVTSSTGDMLEPGETRGYGVNNTNLLYIISANNSTDIVTWSAN